MPSQHSLSLSPSLVILSMEKIEPFFWLVFLSIDFVYLLHVIKAITCRKIEKDIITYDKRIQLTLANRGMLKEAEVIDYEDNALILRR